MLEQRNERGRYECDFRGRQKYEHIIVEVRQYMLLR